MYLETWVDWCGVLGFALSLSLAILEYVKHRTKLRVQTAEYYVIQCFQDRIIVFLRVLIENRSASSISISSAELAAEGLRGDALLGEHVVIGSTLRSAKGSLRTFEYASSCKSQSFRGSRNAYRLSSPSRRNSITVSPCLGL